MITTCNSIESTFDRAAILIGSQRDSFAAVAHCPVDFFFRGATVKEIQLNHNKVALVDDEDYERVSRLTWTAFKNPLGKWYAKTGGGRSQRRLHRFILNLTDPSIKVDHKDGDGLNNQKHNLRIATTAQNGWNVGLYRTNSSGFKGVSWRDNRHKNHWLAKIEANHKIFRLGAFATAEEAARAYDTKARELHGEFARLNFPQEGSNE